MLEFLGKRFDGTAFVGTKDCYDIVEASFGALPLLFGGVFAGAKKNHAVASRTIVLLCGES